MFDLVMAVCRCLLLPL